ncbi:MAG TPA: MBL fold metallo-hydrolase [Pilimelia sp.]|nr:MBL fold metallo-hydrolase [Pilimelia sp.]
MTHRAAEGPRGPQRGRHSFVEVADRVFVLRYPVLDVNISLVVGDGEALLVDTLSTTAQAMELAAAARAVTPYPWTIVNTHHHFDHCFGNATLADADRPVWAHEATIALLREQGDRLRRRWYDEWVTTEPDLAQGLAETPILPPNRTVRRHTALTVGGREVSLWHLGRGHTAGDLVVQVPDAAVVVAGDLVEQGAPPSFEDSYPLEWPETLAALLRLAPDPAVIVPGHGAVVGREFVTGQHAELTALEWLIRDGHADEATAEAVAAVAAARTSLGADAARKAVRRGYAELGGLA